MYRYRMGKGIGGMGVLLIIAAFVLCIIGIYQLTKPTDTATQSTDSADTPTFSESVSKGVQQGAASLKRLWQLLTDQDEAADQQGSGDDTSADDEEDTPSSGGVQVEVVSPVEPVALVPMGGAAQVIIYSTHTHEAFTKTAGMSYEETAKWRTANNDYNIVKVGEALAAELSSKYGIGVVQDKTDTEIPVLATSYERSLQVAKKNIEEYPEAQIIIDLHRDAYNTGIKPNVATVNGVKAARVMFVIGTGEGKTGVGFTLRPDWKSNLALAQSINDNLKAIDPVLSRDISIKTGRYNQHLSKGCVLVEVGNNENTLDEVLATVPFLAQAIAKTLERMPVNTSASAQSTPSASPSASTTPVPTATAPVPASAGATLPPQTIIIEPIPDVTPSPTPIVSATATPSASWVPFPD